jgi:hypothetical protein
MSIADKNYRPITKPRDPINAVYHQLVKLPLGKESDAYIYRLGTEGSENEKLAAALAAQTRKRDRDASESSQTQGEQPKVVDQALEGLRGLLPTAPSTTQLAQAPVQEAPVQMAEGGLAGLDTGDMYNEDSFAAGGIVAFDEGGDVSNYRKDQVSLNLNALPSLNLGNGISGLSEPHQKMLSALRIAGESPNINPGVRIFSRMLGGAFSADPEMIGAFQGKGVPSSVLEGIDYNDYYTKNPSQYLPEYVPSPKQFQLNPNGANTNAQHSALKGMAQGGEVKHFDGTDGSAVDVGRYAPLDDLIELTPEQIDRLSPDQKGAYLRAKQFKAKMAPLSKPETPLYREMMSPSSSQSKTINRVPGLFGNTTDTLPQSNPMSTIGQNPPATKKETYDFDLSNYTPKDKGTARIPLRKEEGVYESSRQRFIDSLGPDEEREAMRKELKRDKEGLMWATVGDIGKALSKAKAGREFEVFGEEDLVGKMLGRKKDIRSLQRDLANAERNERLMANKYGFESEERVQASNEKRMLTQAALDVKEKQIANTGVNALSKMNMGVAKGVQKAKEDWIKNNSMLAGYLSRDPSKASASEKKLIEQAIKSYNAHVTSAENTLRAGLANIDIRPTIETD